MFSSPSLSCSSPFSVLYYIKVPLFPLPSKLWRNLLPLTPPYSPHVCFYLPYSVHFHHTKDDSYFSSHWQLTGEDWVPLTNIRVLITSLYKDILCPMVHKEISVRLYYVRVYNCRCSVELWGSVSPMSVWSNPHVGIVALEFVT